MQKVKVSKNELLTVLKQNRAEHRDFFLKAQEGYRKTVIAELDKALKNARDGREYCTHLNLIPPVDQTKEYDRVIEMLKMSVDSAVELTQQEFAHYVLDEWNWTNHFVTSNMMYAEAPAKFTARL